MSRASATVRFRLENKEEKIFLAGLTASENHISTAMGWKSYTQSWSIPAEWIQQPEAWVTTRLNQALQERYSSMCRAHLESFTWESFYQGDKVGEVRSKPFKMPQALRSKRPRPIFGLLTEGITLHQALSILGLPREAKARISITQVNEAYANRLNAHADADMSPEYSQSRLHQAYLLLQDLFR